MSIARRNRERETYNEAAEVQAGREQIHEDEAAVEDYDDCELDEARDTAGDRTNAEDHDDAGEDYEDCEVKVQRTEEQKSESADEDDDYSDCEKKTENRDAVSVNDTADDRIRGHEADAEPNEARSIGKAPEEMQRRWDEIDENDREEDRDADTVERPEAGTAVDEIAEEERNHTRTESEDAEVMLEAQREVTQADSGEAETNSRGDKDSEGIEYNGNETPADAYGIASDEGANAERGAYTEEALTTGDEAKPEGLDEAVGDNKEDRVADPSAEEFEKETEDSEAEQNTEDAEKNGQEDIGGKQENRAPEGTDSTGNETEEATEGKISDEGANAERGAYTEEALTAVDEAKPEGLDEAVRDNKEDQKTEQPAEEIEGETENNEAEQVSDQEGATLQERVDAAFLKDEVSFGELKGLRAENALALQRKREEAAAIEAERKNKFEEALTMERGSEAYRQSLREHNALQERKESVEDEIAALAQQRQRLDQKSFELRDSMLYQGSTAVTASAATLATVDSLQERYEQAHYDRKPDKTELAEIRNGNCSAIRELAMERDTIKQAMDAKMDVISEYVTSNNMGKYDTAHDARYQQLSDEYSAMQERCDRIGYSIVKLDENSKLLSEQFGDSYQSMVKQPFRYEVAGVKEGSDVPGKTNYFVDEVKASEVLSSFQQNNWEKLTVPEQEQAIYRLADYHTEILGIEKKPRVVFCNKNDACCGSYIAQENVIKINREYMGDGAEAADTIAHEYRHKYQYERAGKPETERDLQFRDSIDHYIRDENDMAGYRDQPVETDARAYAEVFKDKISTLSDTTHEKDGFPAGRNTSAELTTPDEKGSAPKNPPRDDLPDNYERKVIDKHKEVFTPSELKEIMAVANPHYANGSAVWSQIDIQTLRAYKEHNNTIDGHIEKVREKTQEAADTLEAHFKQNNYSGLYSPEIDRRTVEMMSVYHDTGMDGNIKAEDYKAERQAYLADGEIRARYISRTVSEKEAAANAAGLAIDRAAEATKASDKFDREGFEQHFRSDHALESAIHVLRDREHISKLGVNPDKVALGCLIHSKSNSGLRNIASEKEWNDAICKLTSRVNAYQQSHLNEQIHFDSSFLVNKDGSLKQDKLAEMRSEAVALRIGDSNGHDMNSRVTQTGERLELSLTPKEVPEEKLGECKKRVQSGECEAYFAEVQTASVQVGGVELDDTNDPKGVSRAYAVGEGNFKALHCEQGKDGAIKPRFELSDSNAFPLSTQWCIEQRIQEYDSAKPMTYTPVVQLGSRCSKEVYDSYMNFADRIEREYNVRMELET